MTRVATTPFALTRSDAQTTLVRWARTHALLLAVALGTLLRLATLNHLSLWLDEAFSVWRSQQDVFTIWTNPIDPHPPLYYLALHYWLSVSDREWWVRLPSALLGIATIPITFAIGAVLSRARVGLIAAWLLALSPWHIWYSQEARMYAAVCFCGALSLLCALRWLKQPSPKWALAYVIYALLGMYGDYSFFLFWLPTAFGVMVVLGRNLTPVRAVLWMGLQLLVVLGYYPLWQPLRNYAGALVDIRFLFARFGPVAQYFGIGAFVAATALVVGSVLALWLRQRKPYWIRPMLIAVLLLTLLVSIFVMLIPTGLTVKRVLMVWLPFVCVAGAWALEQNIAAWVRPARVLAFSAVAVLLMLALLQKEPWHAVAADLNMHALTGDRVLLEPTHMLIPFDYYNRGALHAEGIAANSADSLPTLLAQSRRVWLIWSSAEPSTALLQWFDQHYTRRTESNYYQISVRLYEARQP